MKVFKAILIFGLISIISSEDWCDGEAPGNSYYDCESYEVLPATFKCCYGSLLVEKGGIPQKIEGCGSVTESQYDNIDEYIQDSKKKIENEGYKVYHIHLDCNKPLSNDYIKFSMLTIILLFFN